MQGIGSEGDWHARVVRGHPGRRCQLEITKTNKPLSVEGYRVSGLDSCGVWLGKAKKFRNQIMDPPSQQLMKATNRANHQKILRTNSTTDRYEATYLRLRLAVISHELVRVWLFGGLTDRGFNLRVAETDTVGGLAAGLPRRPSLALLRIACSSRRLGGAGSRDEVVARLGGVPGLMIRDGANLRSNQRHACIHGYFVAYSVDATIEKSTNERQMHAAVT